MAPQTIKKKKKYIYIYIYIYILEFHSIKILGVHLSYNADKNNDANFFSKIRKMKTKLNLWQTRDLTPFGKSVLDKTLGACQLIYSASLMNVPDAVTRAAQSLLFSVLWKVRKARLFNVSAVQAVRTHYLSQYYDTFKLF